MTTEHKADERTAERNARNAILIRDLFRVSEAMSKDGGYPRSAPLMRDAASEIVSLNRVISGLRDRLRESAS